ncbi:MAG: hypothetical protein ACK4TQ_06260 [Hydrogenophaga sp.]
MQLNWLPSACAATFEREIHRSNLDFAFRTVSFCLKYIFRGDLIQA